MGCLRLSCRCTSNIVELETLYTLVALQLPERSDLRVVYHDRLEMKSTIAQVYNGVGIGIDDWRGTAQDLTR